MYYNANNYNNGNNNSKNNNNNNHKNLFSYSILNNIIFF